MTEQYRGEIQPDIQPNNLENLNVAEIKPLPTPAELKGRLPLPNPEVVLGARQAIGDILYGRDPRILVIAGPCSIHDMEQALEYAAELQEIQRKNPGILAIMRTYFEKPRTTTGWKGLLHDPNLNGDDDIGLGLDVARETLVGINALGVPCGTEMLDPSTPQYFADTLSYGSIGARTVESQTHRQLASGSSMPVGMKNGTSGDIGVAINAIVAARAPHTFPGINGEGRLSSVKTRGNPNAHLILRGGTNGTNYDQDTIEKTRTRLEKLGLVNGIVVDASHGNSNKDHRNQPNVVAEVARQIRDGQQGILGVMLESHINEGNQPWTMDNNFQYGISITDACIGLPTTRRVISDLSDAVASRQ